MIAAIAAVDMNFGIGFENQLLAHIPEDLQYFKQLTTGKVVVMGSNTWASLPKKPLPNRYNIIITRNPVYDEEADNYRFHTWDEVKDFLATTTRDVFIIGGGRVYEELLPYCDKIYLTYICKEFENVDTYFPDFFENEWKETEVSEMKKHNGIQYRFHHYERI
jgi:dihydrofolate reductase